jgi:chemotaxis protein methyltransferase WspC
MAERALSDCGRYEETLLASDEEWQSLVDEIVVRETWFFRDGSPFVFLRRHVREQWAPAHPGRVLRALSVPCATGEEAYSIAITLLDAGMAKNSFRVDAFDVSRTAIARCREAKYGEGSFRGGHLEYRQRYFAPVEGGYRPLPEVTSSVAFRQGNLLDTGFSAAGGPYDVVFCRNLLIYFDLASRKRATDNLHRLLADDGILFTGHVESTYTLGPRFAPVEEPQAFAYRKAAAVPRGEWHAVTRRSRGSACEASWQVPCSPDASRRESMPPDPGTDLSADSKPTRAAAPDENVAPVEDSRTLLEKASRLADEGSLEAAAAICRRLVEGVGPCVEAYCLLGLIQAALGDRLQAEDYYNRALFLHPDHYESLVHLILLVESRGDDARAAALRERAGRIRDMENRHAG